jgi:peptidoglycan/xylan/chitin deacetylase (PgdA/CDA1 family)
MTAISHHICQTGWSFSGVPVLVYHGLSDNAQSPMPLKEMKYWVGKLQFKEHLDCISQLGYQVCSLRNLNSRTFQPDDLHSAVVITFDDGRSSDYHLAFPLLLQASMKAEFFINTANVGGPGYLSWSQIEEMDNAGMSIQSHGHEHLDLSRLPSRELERQLRLSKLILEDRLGRPVHFLAAPHGRLNRRVIKEAIRVGYRAVCSARSLPACPYARKLNRVVLLRDTALSDFQQILHRKPFPYLARLARAPLYWPERLLRWLRTPEIREGALQR